MRIHFTHKNRIKQLYKEGYTIEELIIMYNPIAYKQLKNLTRGIKQEDRV